MVKSGQDVLAGLLFLAVGVFMLVVGRDLPAGTASHMQQGYFPRLVAWSLCAVGAILSIKGMIVPGSRIPRFSIRSLLPLVAVVAFGLLLRPAGLAIAVTVLIFISSAGLEFRLINAVGLSIFLTLFIWLVFICGLGLPLVLWPEF